jgi:outer membrane protein TolC
MVLLLLVPGFDTPARAQGVPVLRLTLEEAVARSTAASHRLAEARARESAARAGVALRESADRPTASAAAGYTRTNHVLEFTVPGPTGVPRVLYPDVPNNYHSRLEIRWPIYTGGQADALERAARAEADAAAAEIRVAQADLRLEVARAYWAVVTARATVAVLERGVERAQAHVADTRERAEAGLAPPNELASATAQEQRARMLAIDARAQREVAEADLRRLVGVDPLQPIDLTTALEPASPAAPSADRVSDLVERAKASRDERQIFEHRISAADQHRLAAAAGRRPSIVLAGGVDAARPNPRIFPRADVWDDSWDAGVSVGWSLWDGGRVAASVAQAAALTEAARHRLAEFDSVLAVDVRQRTLEIESGHAAIAAATAAAQAATEARRVVQERYRAGVSAQIEVLDAEYALLQAELDRTRALAGVRLADARLARAMGR